MHQISTKQGDHTSGHRRKYSGVYSGSSFNENSEYVIKNCMSLIEKKIQAFKLGYFEFEALGKIWWKNDCILKIIFYRGI